MNSQIEVLLEILPRTTNFRIMDILIKQARWEIAADNTKISVDKFTEIFDKEKDLGFTYKTFDFYQNVDLPIELNTYANLIFDSIQKHCRSYKITRPIRYLWNYYNKGSDGTWHIDNGNDPKGKYVTAVYSLNMCDGGTELKMNEGEPDKLYLSRPSTALVFDSSRLHRGVGPKKYIGRFNLTIMMEIKE